MNRARLILLIATGAAVVVMLGLGVVFSSRFQTWAVGQVIAGNPALRLSVGKVDAGLSHVALRDVRWKSGDIVLTAPLVEAELPLLTVGFSDRFDFKRLVAKGWTITVASDVNAPAGAVTSRIPAVTSAGGGQIPAAAAVATGATLQVFAGIFGHLELPRDLTLDQLDLDGTVVLPGGAGRAAVSVRGGGLKAGSEGDFELRAGVAITDQRVSRVSLQGNLRARMDTPRTFSTLALKMAATAEGPQLPNEVTLTSEVTASRDVGGERYAATLINAQQQLIAVRGEFPTNASRLTGTWTLDVRSVDLAPFTLGRPLPTFAFAGEGKFDADAKFVEVRAEGKLSGAVSRLDVVTPKFAGIDAATFEATFDLARRGSTIAVEQFEAAIHAARPVLSLRALQAFGFNTTTGELLPRSPNRDLFGVQVFALPLRWARPMVESAEIQSGILRGEIVAIARAGGMALRSARELNVEALVIALAGKPAWQPIDIGFNVGADYTPRGWQAEVSGFTVRGGTTPMLLLDAKAGQLNGTGEALKAAGKLSADVPALLRLIGAGHTVPLTSGAASVEFVASFTGKKEIQAKIKVRELAATIDGAAQTFPAVTTDLRADIDPAGDIALNAPLVLEHAGRTSDLKVTGTIGAVKDGARSVQGSILSNHLVLDDTRILGALLADPKPARPEAKLGTAPQPGRAQPVLPRLAPWSGLHGSLALQLQRVILLDTFEMTNVGGNLRLEAGVVKFETVHAGLGDSGLVQGEGELKFDPTSASPYGLVANVNLREFNPGPLLQRIDPGQPPAVEGRFDVVTKLTASGANLEALPPALVGDIQLTSKGGIFRGLPVNASNLAETSSRIAALITSAGAALGALTGRRDYPDVANKAEAAGELARTLSAIKFDQLSARLSRDEALTTQVREFSLIAPELRLAGGGVALRTPGKPVVDDALALEFILKARGRQGDLLRYLGLLDAQIDDLGYAACTVPVKIGGTVGRPDATEFSHQITALALEKSGLSEKAADLLARIRGNGK